MSKVSEHFGLAVRNIRKRTGITQEELAHLAKIDRTYMSAIERGKKNPSIRVIYQLSQGLGVAVSDIVHEFEKEIKTKKEDKK